MAIEYDPATELVLVPLKSGTRTSTVRERTLLPESKKPACHGQLPSRRETHWAICGLPRAMARDQRWTSICLSSESGPNRGVRLLAVEL